MHVFRACVRVSVHSVHGLLRYEMQRSGETGTIRGALQMLSSLKGRNVMRQSKERRGERRILLSSLSDFAKKKNS